MRTLGMLALGVVLLIGGGVLFYKGVFPTYSYRYHMTAEVTVDGVVHSGSSVIEVRFQRQPPLGPNFVFPSVRGEAAYVDLGRGRNILGLLASREDTSNRDYPIYLVPEHFGRFIVDESDLKRLSGLKGRWDLPDDRLPAFVSFGNLTNVNSARVVAPEEFADVLGSGVQLKSVSIELTEDPVTYDIEKRLSWLPNFKWSFGGESGSIRAANFIRRR